MKPISIALLAASLLAAGLAGGTAGVVPSTCAPCHKEAKTQAASNMAKAL